MKKSLWLIGFFVALISGSANAEFFLGEGGTGSSFLSVPLNARGAALGGAMTAVSEDLALLEYNPAGLKGIKRKNIDASYISFIEDTSLKSISFGMPWNSPTDSKNNQHRQDDSFYLAFHYRDFTADENERNSIGVKLGEFGIKDQLFQFSGAYVLGKQLTFGLSGKFIKNKIQNDSKSTAAGDLGLLWEAGDNVSFGASVLNIGQDNKFKSQKDAIPTTAHLGVALNVRRLLLLADLSYGREEIAQPAGGIEYALNRYVKLRGGALYHTTFEFSGGLGIDFTPEKNSVERAQRSSRSLQYARLKKSKLRIGLDFAVQTRNELGLMNSATLRLNF